MTLASVSLWLLVVSEFTGIVSLASALLLFGLVSASVHVCLRRRTRRPQIHGTLRLSGFPVVAVARTKAGDWRDPSHINSWGAEIVADERRGAR